jgi:hypothetical protein
MATEGSGRRELAQFMSDHVLSDIDRYMSAPIVNRNGVANHLWENGALPAPCAQHFPLPYPVHILNLPQ